MDSKWKPEEDLTYTPVIRPENIPLIGENKYSGIYAFRTAGCIVRNYAANHPHTRRLCAGLLCAGSMDAEHLALLKMLYPGGEGIDDYDDEGMTPLMLCIRSAGRSRNGGSLEAVKFLVGAGADVSRRRNHDTGERARDFAITVTGGKIIMTDREALEMFLNCELGYPDEVFDKFVMLEARYFG